MPAVLTLEDIQKVPTTDGHGGNPRRDLLLNIKRQRELAKTAPYLLQQPYEGWQRKFSESQARIRIAHAANRTGKTWVSVREALLMMTSTHPTRKMHDKKKRHHFRVVANDLEHGIKNWVDTLHDLLPPSMIIKDYLPSHTTDRRFVIKAPEGHSWYFDFMTYGMEPRQFGSVEITHFTFDEVPPSAIFWHCLFRTVAHGGTIDIAATPELESADPGFFVELVGKARSGELKDCELFCGSVYDAAESGVFNYTIDDMKRLEASMPEDQARARIHGEVFLIGGLVFKEYRDMMTTADPPGHVFDPDMLWPAHGTIPAGTPPNDWQIVGALDPSVNGYTAHLWCALSPYGERYYFDEYQERDRTVPTHAEAIRALEKERGYKVEWRVIDPAAKAPVAWQGSFQSIQDSYALCDVPCITHMALRDEMTRIERTNSGFLPRGPEGQKQPAIFISKYCHKLRTQLLHVAYQTNRNSNELNPKQKVKDKDNHLTDCLGYLEMMNPQWEPPEQKNPTSEYIPMYSEIGY